MWSRVVGRARRLPNAPGSVGGWTAASPHRGGFAARVEPWAVRWTGGCRGTGGPEPIEGMGNMRGATADLHVGLTDQLLVICLYRHWKDAAAEVSVAYERFRNAWPESSVAFAAYRAALDREEAAARLYASRVAVINNPAA
jgi:hypothetical protein